MNIMINNKILIATLLTFVAFSNAFSQAMDSSFTYQGELIDNGVPANGQYDINLDLIDGDLQTWGNTSIHSPVNVVNGVFSVNADFDISYYNGYKDFTITVSIRKTSEGPGGAFTTLGSQTVQAVPMATNLTNGSATVGQVLTFNGFQWNPADPSNSSLWTAFGSEIIYPSNVGIGVANPGARLHVATSVGHAAKFEGGQNMYVTFTEDGVDRGYIGSYVSGTGINDEDFEIGTYGDNNVGGLQFTIQNEAKMTIAHDGKVGIGNVTPNADLNIDATDDGDVIRVRVNNNTKFYVDDNGGTGVGAWTTPPVDGLRVQGDVKQPTISNGMMKFMVRAICSDTSASITRSYNGINSSSITISEGASAGKCVIDFPSDITNRYFQVSAMSSGSGSGSVRSANCTIANENLSCVRFNPTSGAGVAGSIMILVY